MITVSILINGQPIYTRSAYRESEGVELNTYKLDTGERIYHKYDDGAVVLAKKMLDTILED
mgnify:CR=1 FL=1|jgi:hypothetical protein